MFDGPPRPAETAISSAVNRLLAAGMVLRYRSLSGNSYYLGWPGRKGVLRVSDHAGRSPNEERNPIYAKLTIHENSMPKNETNMERMLARALGSFLLKAPIDEVTVEIIDADEPDTPCIPNWKHPKLRDGVFVGVGMVMTVIFIWSILS